jgi:hypothetical protein
MDSSFKVDPPNIVCVSNLTRGTCVRGQGRLLRTLTGPRNKFEDRPNRENLNTCPHIPWNASAYSAFLNLTAFHSSSYGVLQRLQVSAEDSGCQDHQKYLYPHQKQSNFQHGVKRTSPTIMPSLPFSGSIFLYVSFSSTVALDPAIFMTEQLTM